MNMWDKALMHPPASIESEISWIRDDIARLRIRWAKAVLDDEPEMARLYDMELDDLVEELERKQAQLPLKSWPPRPKRWRR